MATYELEDFTSDEIMGRVETIANAVHRFSKLVHLKLLRNIHKPGWTDESMRHLYHRLQQEMTELESELPGPDSESILSRPRLLRVVDECLDVAGFAMMIADNAWRLRRAAHQKSQA